MGALWIIPGIIATVAIILVSNFWPRRKVASDSENDNNEFSDVRNTPAVKQVDIDLAYLQAEFPIGTEFDFLGVRVRVCEHYNGHYSCSGITRLKGDYVDGHGKFAPVSFSMLEARALVDGPNAVTILRKEKY